MARVVHPIEKQSYEILRARADTSALPPWTRAVVERVIHASADTSYLGDLVCAEADLEAALAALRGGAPVVTSATSTTWSARKRTWPRAPRRCATARRSWPTRR